MTESFLRREILEQTDVLARLLEQERAHAQQIVRALARHAIEYITIAARGSSDNAAIYAKYVFPPLTRLPIALATPSLYTLYRAPPRLAHTLVIAISQSGESTDIVAVVEEARKQNAPTLAITNRADSTLARVCDEVIWLNAGEEKSVAATKTYSASLGALALLALAWSDSDARAKELDAVPAHISAALATETHARDIANSLANLTDCAVIGRGFNNSSAFEVALKLKELAYLHAEPYSSADFLHGPFALVDERFRAFVFAPGGAIYANMVEFTERLKSAGARVIGISDREEFLKLAGEGLPLPANIPEWLSPFAAIVPGQWLALYLTQAKGYDVDQPRGITKVTRTL